MTQIVKTLKLAKECTYADAMTDGAKEYLRNEIDKALDESLEKRTSDNMDLISSFIEHYQKETGTVFKEKYVLSFFNA